MNGGMNGALQIVALSLALLAPGAFAAAPSARHLPPAAHPPLADFQALLDSDEATTAAALQRIGKGWRNAYAGMLLEAFWFTRNRPARAGIAQLLERASGRKFDGDPNPWYEWLWSIEPGEHPQYAEFKAAL